MGFCIISVKVWPVDIEYKKKYKSNEKELQYAVEEHLYPPAISLEVVQNVAKHLRSHKRIHLHVYGAKEGMMNFPIDLFEEKEGLSWLCTYIMYVWWEPDKCHTRGGIFEWLITGSITPTNLLHCNSVKQAGGR